MAHVEAVALSVVPAFAVLLKAASRPKTRLIIVADDFGSIHFLWRALFLPFSLKQTDRQTDRHRQMSHRKHAPHSPGICMERSRGIIHAIKHGAVTYTAVVANGSAAIESIALLRAEGLLGRVGLHLNLTEGRPLSDPGRVPSLLCPDGGGLLRGKRGLREACAAGLVRPDEAVEEAEAQIRWFRAHVGETPTHINGHQHCHVIPALRGKSPSKSRL